jgi:hypothetical protein
MADSAIPTPGDEWGNILLHICIPTAVAALSQAERHLLARRRLVRVLAAHTVATGRTLEQKISDAGPSHMRIDPHVLTNVRADMMREGVIAESRHGGARWYHLTAKPAPEVEGRLAELIPIHAAMQQRPRNVPFVNFRPKFRARSGVVVPVGGAETCGSNHFASSVTGCVTPAYGTAAKIPSIRTNAPLVRSRLCGRANSSRAENEHGRLRNLSWARLMAAVTAGLADVG